MKVRIAVAVAASGDWNACGFRGADDDVMDGVVNGLDAGRYRTCWIVADVPEPEPEAEVAGEVTQTEPGSPGDTEGA